MDMTFADFCNVYEAEVRPRVREHTWLTKENIIQSKLIPFFGDMRMCDIRPVDIVRWQNSLTGSTRPDGDVFKPTYLRIINNQLNAIFNHAERYYNLEKNPVHKVDKMGSKEAGEMQFWTKDEYLRFSDAISTSRLPSMRSRFSTGWAYAAASSWRSRPRTSCWKRPSFA